MYYDEITDECARCAQRTATSKNRCNLCGEWLCATCKNNNDYVFPEICETCEEDIISMSSERYLEHLSAEEEDYIDKYRAKVREWRNEDNTI